MIPTTPWRKVLRDIWANRARTALIVLTIAAGVFAIGTIGATALTIQRQVPAQYKAIRPAHFLFATSLFDAEIVDTITSIEGVADAEVRRNLSVRLLIDPASDTWKDLFLFGITDFDDQRVDKIWPVSGAWPPPKGTLLIERGSMEYLSLREGQEITVKIVQGKRHTLTISGVAHDLYHMPAFIEGYVYGYITSDTLLQLHEPELYDELYVRVDGNVYDQTFMQELKNEITDHLERSGVVIFSTEQPKPDGYPMEYITKTVVLLLTLLGVLVLLLGVLLVISTMSALVAQQARQIAVIKAVGGSTRQVLGIYLRMVVILGVLSTLVAIPFSRLAARELVAFINGLLNYNARLEVFPLEIIVLQVGLAVLLPVIAALVPVWGSARQSPALALSEYGHGRVWSGMYVVDFVLRVFRRITRLELLALRNPFRNRSRLLFSLIMLSLAGGSFIMVINLQTSLRQTVDSMLSHWQYDFWVVLDKAYLVERLGRYATTVPGVSAVEGWGVEMTRRVRPDGSESNPIFFFAAPPESPMLSPKIIQGRWLQTTDENALVIGIGLLEAEPDLEVGKEVVLRVNGEEQHFHIVGICEMLGNQTVGFITYTSFDTYNHMMRQKKRANMLVVKTTATTPEGRLVMGSAVEKVLKAAGVKVASVLQMDDERLEIDSAFNILLVLLLIMVILLSLVGGLGLMGTMSLNVLERSREIGVIRAFGGSNGSVMKLVVLEGVAIGVMSWLFALLLAIPLTWLFCNLIGHSFLSMSLGVKYSAVGAFLWLVLVIVLAAFSSMLPALNAVRLTVREVLSYE